MKAVLLAAGKGTRCWPLTDTRPKPLLPVANKTLLEHNLDALTGLVDEVILIVKYKQEMIREALGSTYGVIKLTYVEQPEPLGTGHAVAQAEKHVKGSRFLLLNGDDLYAHEDLKGLAEHEYAVLTQEVEPAIASRFGIFIEKNGKITDLVEKPEDPPSCLASTGAFSFGPKIFNAIRTTPRSAKGEYFLSEAVQRMMRAGQEYHCRRVEGHWLPVGYCWNMLEANKRILDEWAKKKKASSEGDVKNSARIDGAVWIGTGTIIRDGARIQGPTIIGDDCEIGPDCIIKPHCAIGNGCKVGQSVELENAILLPGAELPSRNHIRDSVIGADVNFGEGSDVMNARLDKKAIHVIMGGPLKGKNVDTGRSKLGAIIGDGVRIAGNVRLKPGRMLGAGERILNDDF